MKISATAVLLLLPSIQGQEEDGGDGNEICCEALVAECLACMASTTIVTYCDKRPSTPGCDDLADDNPTDDPAEPPNMCCYAYNSDCLSCIDGEDEATYCETHKDIPGCDEFDYNTLVPDEDTPTDGDLDDACCEALTPACSACTAGVETWEYCERLDWEMEGCEAYRGDVPFSPGAGGCCKAYTAECNACVAEETIGHYCQYHPSVHQCPDWLLSEDSLAGDTRARIDAWLAKGEGINEFGDPSDLFYLGGNPLFDEYTGEMIDIYTYIARQHDTAPWMVAKEVEESDDASTLGGTATMGPSNDGTDGDIDAGSDDGDGGNNATVAFAVMGGVGGFVFAGAFLAVYLKLSRKEKDGGHTQVVDGSGDDAGKDDANEMMEMHNAEIDGMEASRVIV